jgi:predicted lipoprotein with Yx(FWY)xxD motif
MPLSHDLPARMRGQRPRRNRWFGIASGASALLLSAALLANLALASVTPTVSASHDSMLNKTVVADAHGRTLYALNPETVHHLLCRSHACFEAWPPVTVRSHTVKLLAGHGVEGHLALLKRSDGKLQVTLRGTPLYRYSGDSTKGEANGEGIRSFGGKWHTVLAKPAQTVPSTMSPTPTTTTPMSTTPTTTMPSSPPPHYGY